MVNPPNKVEIDAKDMVEKTASFLKQLQEGASLDTTMKRLKKRYDFTRDQARSYLRLAKTFDRKIDPRLQDAVVDGRITLNHRDVMEISLLPKEMQWEIAERVINGESLEDILHGISPMSPKKYNNAMNKIACPFTATLKRLGASVRAVDELLEMYPMGVPHYHSAIEGLDVALRAVGEWKNRV